MQFHFLFCLLNKLHDSNESKPIFRFSKSKLKDLKQNERSQLLLLSFAKVIIINVCKKVKFRKCEASASVQTHWLIVVIFRFSSWFFIGLGPYALRLRVSNKNRSSFSGWWQMFLLIPKHQYRLSWLRLLKAMQKRTENKTFKIIFVTMQYLRFLVTHEFVFL